MNTKKVHQLIKDLLIEIGEDPEREGLLKTPERVARMYEFLTAGYNSEPEKIINNAHFSQQSNNMIIVKNIEVYSLCEHHMLPFFGKCHIGYLSHEKVVGVSKLVRIVDMYARRLQLQERLTEQVAEAIGNNINALGVGVVIEAQHLCMMMRGVQKQNSVMITSSVLGQFRKSQKTREEFLALIGQS